MKVGAVLFLALVMPFGVLVLAGMLVKYTVKSIRQRQLAIAR